MVREIHQRQCEYVAAAGAEVYYDWKGRRIHRRHSFSNYLLFAVDDKQKISAPRLKKRPQTARQVAGQQKSRSERQRRSDSFARLTGWPDTFDGGETGRHRGGQQIFLPQSAARPRENTAFGAPLVECPQTSNNHAHVVVFC
jgi:hypothetical protein